MAIIRSTQQQTQNVQIYGKTHSNELAQEKIDALEKELDDMPIVQQFIDAQENVNDILQMVSHAISSSVTYEVIERTGGDHLEGETGAGMKNKASKDVE